MARPIPTTAEEHLQRLAQDVAMLRKQPSPSNVLHLPSTPTPITGSRSTNTVSVLTQLLAALDALGIIDDDTTG